LPSSAENGLAMAAFSPQLLTVMQDLSGWVLAGRTADAAAALGRWSETQPALVPLSAAACAIAGLPTGADFQRNGFLKILTAPETAAVLSAISEKDVSALDRAFRMEGRWGLYGAEQALLNLVQGVFDAGSPFLTKAVIAGVVEAGGLGDLALMFEKAKGGLSDRDYARTSERLHGLTSRFQALVPRYERSLRQEPAALLPALESAAMISEGASRFVREQGSPDLLRELNLLAGLRQYLQDQVHASLSRGGQALLTELLQVSDARGPATAGRCLSTSVLTAHIAHAAGVRIDALSHNCAQLSLSLRDTPLVVDTTPWSVAFRTEDDWKSMGLLGKGQRPGPLGDLLGGYVNAVVGLADKGKSGDFLREGLEAALKIAPNHFTTLINKAYLERGNPQETRRIVERLSRLDPKSPWLPFLEAYILRAQGRRREAKMTFELALRVFREEGRRLLGNQRVSIVANEVIELALDDFIALCVHDDDLMRATIQLAQFSNDPDESIRGQAILLMMALRGGGAQA
jgi:tetratricopeptide (TPR) repeat protein